MFHITVDGNDGLGKSTLVERIKTICSQLNSVRHEGFLTVSDRGLPTRLTDIPEGDWESIIQAESKDGDIYIILDGPVELSQARLKEAGKSLDEKYHNFEDLTHYREKFLRVAALLPNCHIIDANKTKSDVLGEFCKILMRY